MRKPLSLNKKHLIGNGFYGLMDRVNVYSAAVKTYIYIY